MDKQAKDLKDYVISRKELVHPNVIKMVLQGDREGLRMAMNHIHYNSLRERRVIKNMQAVLEKDKGDAEKKLKEGVKTGKIEEQSYKNALVEKGDQKRWVRKEHRFLGQKKGGNHDRFQKNSVVFVHNLPENSNSLQIWNFMRKWGRALDCILPMRKDKLGKRFGFIKLQSIAEAENFIKGVHGKMLDGNIIRAQFANKQIKQVGIKERKDFKQSKMSSLSQGRKQEPLPCTPDEIIKKTVGAIKLEDADHKLSLEIERSLVVSTLKACSIVEVLNTIESLGYDGVLVRRLSSSKFLVTFSSSDCFSNLDQDLFGLGFLDCKSVSLEDLIPPRKAVLVCLGLPVTLWKFSNFSKILEGIGYITAISRLLDENLQFKNPMFEVETKEMSEINKVLTVQHEDNIMEELKGTEMDEDHEEINHNICSQEGSIHDDEIEGREEEAAVPILINNDKEVNGDQTLGNDSAQEANSADNYLGAAPMHDNNKDNEKNNHLVQGDFFKSQNTLELRDTVLETQETLETQEELVVQESQVESVIQETTKDLEVLETLETREDLMGQESQVESVIQETSDELVLKDPNENSISSKCNPIWSVREAESSSIADAHNSEATSRSSSVYVARQEKEQSSSGSIKKAEDCFLKLKLGRKRGRPPKRKLRKGGQPSGQPFVCVNVYAPQLLTDKRRLWAVLKEFILLHEDKAIAVVGDFNCVRNMEERKNCIYQNSDSFSFNEFIESSELFEVTMVGSDFTWCGPSAKLSKLDRVLANWEFYSRGNWKVEVLGRMNSDHRAMLLNTSRENWGAKPFKMFECWLNNEQLLDKIKRIWKEEAAGNFHQKIRHIRRWVADWNKNENGNIEMKIQSLEKDQFQADELGDIAKSKIINSKLEKCYDERAQMWQQKARINWQLKGDRNTKYFHNIMKYKWSKNKIRGVHNSSDVWITEPKELQEEFYAYFKDFFKEKRRSDIFKIGNLLSKRLDEAEAERLVQMVTMEELELALSQSPSNKAPGPDGFDAGSLKKMWGWIKDEMLECINKFMHDFTLPGGFNSSFIALIPKLDAPKRPKDYRPISLINAGMKLITKILATRLKMVLNKLISEVQSGFMQGRQISDGILLVSEIIGSMKKKKCQGIILKLDFEKAFDSVNWDFLLHLLHKFNFHGKWIKWIEVILKTSRISVLVNGSPSREFIPERGLRQGDPLSPLLFNLVGEVLHCMLCKAEEAGIFQGVKLGEIGGTVSHLQYADDTVIFVKNDSESIRGIKRVLLGFEMLTGLRINFGKSTLYGFNSTAEELTGWSEIIGCKLGSDSFTYLGLELAKSPNRVQFWDPLVSKVKKKLAAWKGRSISMTGRIILLQAALDSLPIYWFNMFLIPRTVENQLEKIRRRFFWGLKEINGQDRDNLHLIAWEKICQPKSSGGLGLTKVRERNIAMLGKWWWRCINERNRFWNVTLQGKYGSILGIDPSGITLDGSSSYTLATSWCWAEICNSWSLSRTRLNGTEFSLDRLLGLVSDPEVKEAWQLVVSATLWTIWLFRNALVFNKVKTSKGGVLSVLRARITTWLEISGIIYGKYGNLFWVNPWGAVRVVFKHKYDEFWESIKRRYDWVAMVDGAFHKNSNNTDAKAGVGGMIKSRNGIHDYIFSGPACVKNALDAELEACMHVLRVLYENLKEFLKEEESIVICSDSMEAVNYMNKLRCGHDVIGLVPTCIINFLVRVDFKHINRRFNLEADGLAKEGLNRFGLVEGWI
ncbi:hypothetical protein DCAR_0727751 [Daucus carota subsp. sativus]|uniref:Reverse transcriptase domain-containing protein n=1 Tax=Daucus carota subsp. sativus TaxID=79200 RepID=A0AAF0XHU4_DAUCS|nr:hypothetical protein DCAR_0727751 [Daucus carota subsp. sativus]